MAEAAPFYDFVNPSMKPWHLVATYQLYDHAGIVEAVLAKKIAPVYPQEAKARSETGTVLLQARIGIDGKIRNEQLVMGAYPLLNDSAFKAVSQWVYKPCLVNGKPVEVETLIKVIYTLDH